MSSPGQDVAGPSRIRSFKAQGKATLRTGNDSSAADGAQSWCTFSDLSFTFPLKLMSPRLSSQNAAARIAAYRAEEDRKGKARASNEAGATSTEAWLYSAGPGGIKPVGVLYIVGYGGGLVSGDDVRIDFDVGTGTTMLLLTQGSTKVFKLRRVASKQQTTPVPSAPRVVASDDEETQQYFRMLVRPGATLVILPDPVTCYKHSKYRQVQRVDLRCKHTSSLVLLDWYTPGRTYLARTKEGSKGADARNLSELWGFESYRSRNEIRIEGRDVVKDSLLLEQGEDRPLEDGARSKLSNLARRNAPYGCYATLFLVGPDCQRVIHALEAEYNTIQQFRVREAPSLLWSFSVLDTISAETSSISVGETRKEQELRTAVARVAGADADAVRAWFRDRLHGLQAIIGDDLYKQALGTDSESIA
jgi:urease accessory protein